MAILGSSVATAGILKPMKSIMCQHCQEMFSGETKEAVQLAMLPHYKEQHADIMSSNTSDSKQAWMQEFDRRWEAA